MAFLILIVLHFALKLFVSIKVDLSFKIVNFAHLMKLGDMSSEYLSSFYLFIISC